jgi:predicted O-methyltransferase YrrM
VRSFKVTPGRRWKGAQMNGTPASGFEFTNDWFGQNIPIWDQLIPRFSPTKFLEIGSYEGRSTCYLIEKFTELSGIDIHCIDTWEGGVEHDKATMSDVERRFDNNTALAQKNAKHATVVTKHKKFSQLALADLIAAGQSLKFDVIYVDGSHQAPDVLTDCVMAFQLLRIGGLMIFDDYIWTMEAMGKQDAFNMPKPAIDAFLNIFQRKMQIVRGAPVYQLYAAKVGS